MNEIEHIIHTALKGDGNVSPERRIINALNGEGYLIFKLERRNLDPRAAKVNYTETISTDE